MRAFSLFPFIVAVLCFRSLAVAADMVAAFSDLPKGDELEMTFDTCGCFHSATFELKFRRSARLTVSVVEVERVWSRDLKTFGSTNRVSLGKLTLRKSDVDGLDQLLRFYRARTLAESTTVDTISISQRHDGKVVATEQFIDRSCSYERKDLTRIMELVTRLEKQK